MIDLHFYGLLADHGYMVPAAAATQEHDAHPSTMGTWCPPAIRRSARQRFDQQPHVSPGWLETHAFRPDQQPQAASLLGGQLQPAESPAVEFSVAAIPARRLPRPRPDSATPGPRPRCGRPCFRDERRSAARARSLGQPPPRDRTRRVRSSTTTAPPPRPAAARGPPPRRERPAWPSRRPRRSRATRRACRAGILVQAMPDRSPGSHSTGWAPAPRNAGSSSCQIFQRLPPGRGRLPIGQAVAAGPRFAGVGKGCRSCMVYLRDLLYSCIIFVSIGIIGRQGKT